MSTVTADSEYRFTGTVDTFASYHLTGKCHEGLLPSISYRKLIVLIPHLSAHLMAATAVIYKLPEKLTCFSAAGAGVLGSVLSVMHAVFCPLKQECRH